MPDDLHQTYRTRLAERQARVAALETKSARIANLRLGCFLLLLALAWPSPVQHHFTGWLLLIPAAAFASLVVWHDRALRAQKTAERAAAYYDRGLARIEDRWMNQGETGERFAEPSHPYAADLDLFGPGSLFQLLCTARTASGEAALAGWLTAPAPVQVIRARQKSVQALTPRLDLREDLAALGTEVRAAIDPARLQAWGAEPVEAVSWPMRLLSIALAVAAVGLLLGWGFWDLSPWPFAVALVAEYALLRALRPSIERAVAAVDRAGEDLNLLSATLARIEREDLPVPEAQVLKVDGTPASVAIAKLRARAQQYEARYNQFFRPLGFLLLWDVHTASALAAWRRRFGSSLGGWLRAVGEVEALCALSAYAAEHPADPFPVLLDSGTTYDADALGHPLIPADRCVRNDVTLAGGCRLVLVSGSNMSGKSTYLRTVGINAVLAQSGAPVRAAKLTLSPVRIGATLRIQDSLQEGASRFYAEITRLKQVLDLTQGPVPALFLLDEILHGTNSHDRRQGAEAVIRALLERGALGLVTTHDLALAELATALGPVAVNAHFEDTVEEGALAFDYRKRDGVVRSSNALALMRAVGLPV